MEINELLGDLFGRVTEHVHEAVDGLDAAALAAEPTDGTNTIGWLVWHLTRVQDHHFSELEGKEQVWMSGDWPQRFGVEPDAQNTGYGHSATQMASIKPDSADALTDYYDAVYSRTTELLKTTKAADLDRVVDKRWDPPVTLGVRLISVADDCIQHSGQAAYARGIIDRS